MKLDTPINPNYCVTVVKLDRFTDIENADRLKYAVIFGNSVIVGKDMPLDTVGIFFPIETQISHDFVAAHNLYRDWTLNKANDEKVKGFFEKKGRVRAVRLRGNKSEGFFIPMSDIADEYSVIRDLPIGSEFDKLGDQEICKKYVVYKAEPGMKSNRQGKAPRFSRLVDDQFRLHIDTINAKKGISNFIKPNDIVSVTNKLHGCVSGDTLIDTDSGTFTIKDIVDNKMECKVKSYDTVSSEVVYSDIGDYYFKADHGEWYEIELESGEKVKITGNNPVWIPSLNDYVKVEDLTEGMEILFD
jgi:hypothetical protein